MSFGFDPTPPEKISKSWRDDQVGECRFASVREPSWGHRGLLATSVRGHSPPPQTLLGRRAITVSWRCQFRSGCRIAGAALYSLPAAGGGGDGSIGGRALPGPSVSSARAEQLSGGRVHQESKQLSPGKLSLQPHSNTIHSTNCRPFMKP